MGAYGLMLDAIHAGQISDLIEKYGKMEKDLETARLWIEHLTKRIEVLENEQKNSST